VLLWLCRQLAGDGNREMVHVDASGCVYLNAATVPRVVAAPRRGGDGDCAVLNGDEHAHLEKGIKSMNGML
jgi:hypothetical protein